MEERVVEIGSPGRDMVARQAKILGAILTIMILWVSVSVVTTDMGVRCHQ